MRRFSTLELHWIQKPQRHFTFIPKSPWLGFLSTPAWMRFSVVPKDAWRLISCCSMNVRFHVHNEGCLSPTSGSESEKWKRFTVFTDNTCYLLFWQPVWALTITSRVPPERLAPCFFFPFPILKLLNASRVVTEQLRGHLYSLRLLFSSSLSVVTAWDANAHTHTHTRTYAYNSK